MYILFAGLAILLTLILFIISEINRLGKEQATISETYDEKFKKLESDLESLTKNVIIKTGAVEVINRSELPKAYAKIRKDGIEIKATWCGQYGDVKSYFEEEEEFFKRLNSKGIKNTVIRRLVNPLSISLDEFLLCVRHFENLKNKEYGALYECRLTTEIRGADYMVSKNSSGVERAVYSIVSNFKPGFGVVIEPQHYPDMGGQVNNLSELFNDIWNHKQTIPMITFEKLWDQISADYDKFVTGTHNFLLQQYMAEEERIILEQIELFSKYHENFSIVEIGSGTGRVLFKLYEKLDRSIRQYIGIDFSISMKNRALKELDLEYKEAKDIIHFVARDATSWKDLQDLKNTSPKIICCLLNTIGAMDPSKRKDMIENMIKLSNGGKVIITVFDGDAFDELAPLIYDPIEEMVGKIETLSYDKVSKVFRTGKGYFSQWLTKGKMNTLLEDKKPERTLPINISLNPSSADDHEKIFTMGNAFVINTLS